MASAGERQAAIKVNLDSGEFLAELRHMAQELKDKSEEGKRAFKGIAAGVDAAKSAIGRMADTAKRGLTMMATLGGGFSVGAAVKGAIELDARYRSLADRAQRAGNAQANAADIQRDVERAASKAKVPLEDMQKAYDDLFTATGSLDDSRAALQGIGTTATATRKSVDTIGQVAGTLNEKFKIAGKDMDEALATVIGNTDIGGPKLEDLAGIADQLGSNLLEAGLRGQRGLSFMLGSLNRLDDEMGGVQKSARGMSQLLLNLGKGSEMKAMAKDLGIDPSKLINEKDAIARLMKILSFGQAGLKTLKANFVGPEERKALRLLFTDPFEEALNRARARGLKGKDAVDAALKVLEGQINDFGKTSVTAAGLQKKAAEVAQDPMHQLTDALNILKKAVAQPEMVGAINEAAQRLPALAGALGNFLSFAAKNPLLAGAVGVGGNIGFSFLEGVGGELGKHVYEAHIKGGIAAADKMVTSFITGGNQASGALAVAGKAFGIAAAAIIAYEVGKAVIDAAVDPKLKEVRETEGGTEAAIANAAGGGSVKVLKARLAQLDAAVDKEKSADLGSGFMDQTIATFGGPDVQAMSKDRIKRAREARIELMERIRKQQAIEANPVPAAGPVAAAQHVQATVNPHAVASAMSTALGGQVLSVRIVNTPGGIGAVGRSMGSRGPLAMNPPAHGGGV